MTEKTDVLVIGAGAAGMMCAIEAARRDRRVMIIDHAETPAEKIRISGGGRCNFTNLHTTPENFLSENPHFCKSALKRFTQHDFIKRVDARRIPWHEKTLGQLFCDNSAKDIIDMLLDDMRAAKAALFMETSVSGIEKNGDVFHVTTDRGVIECTSLVIATGGLSIPKIGATGFGYDVARQFGHDIIPTRAALVPLRFAQDILTKTKELSGLSVDPSAVSHGKTSFREGMLFTHKGISGPSILQISSYWQDGDDIVINMLPDVDIYEELRARRQSQAKQMLHNVLAGFIPKRLADQITGELGIDAPMADLSDKKLRTLADRVQAWHVTPTDSEGYRTAEVTRGGVDTRQLSSKTMESQKTPGLYFIGEVVDVTGWLGGYNFQWAWSSGWVAGQYA